MRKINMKLEIVKLPAHSAGFPGNDLLFNIVPLDPAQHAPVNPSAPWPKGRGLARPNGSTYQDGRNGPNIFPLPFSHEEVEIDDIEETRKGQAEKHHRIAAQT